MLLAIEARDTLTLWLIMFAADDCFQTSGSSRKTVQQGTHVISNAWPRPYNISLHRSTEDSLTDGDAVDGVKQT